MGLGFSISTQTALNIDMAPVTAAEICQWGLQVWTAHMHVKRNLFAAVAQQRNAEVQMADDECGNALACLQV